MTQDATPAEAIALIIAGGLQQGRTDIEVDGPMFDADGKAFLHVYYDEGLSFQIGVALVDRALLKEMTPDDATG